MKRLLADERGVTMIELLVVIVLAAIVMTPVVALTVAGVRASSNSNARLSSQQNTRLALDRLEFEGRCANNASLVNSGQGVTFSLPTTCSHANGQVTWCVVSGTLTRYTSNACSGGSSQKFVTNVTTATPFTIPTTASGDLPQLDVNIGVNFAGNSTSATLTDTITLRNASRAS
jgi:prepilin-type N-terminal cleavage/methylation domain-containing protein